LTGQPQISVVARDRGGGYALAVQRAFPRRHRFMGDRLQEIHEWDTNETLMLP
jgi:hypothetical protein